MKEITEKSYYNRVLGSWQGRVAGDFVGAPLEFMPYNTIYAKYGEITTFPEPINLDYVNDDEMYEICALVSLEKNGINTTATEISREWVDLLYDQNFTAEYIALQNLRSGILPPQSGLYNNYYFDAIGAQMRADIWGQICPGVPEIAKYYANLDASISHAGIGIEGEIYISVLISNAFFETDIRILIENALNYIPSAEKSLYTQMVIKAIEIFDDYPSDFRTGRNELLVFWDDVRRNQLKVTGVSGSKSESLLSKKRLRYLKTQPGVHVLPNIGIIILSLLYGNKDQNDPFGRTICISAMMGLDTDCNCGNLGAIMGAKLGSDAIPLKWREPLQDTFSTYIKGYEKWKISELAIRIVNIGKKVINEKSQNQVRII